MSLSASANPSRITSPNTQYRENQPFMSVNPSRNTSTIINRSTATAGRSGANSIVPTHTEEHVNAQTNTHFGQSQSHLNNNNNYNNSFNPVTNYNSNNSISRPPIVRRAASVLEVSRRRNTTTNSTTNESYSHHDHLNNDNGNGPHVQEEHPHYREEELLYEYDTSHSHRSNQSRNVSTLLQPLESQNLFAPPSNSHSHITPEPAHEVVNEYAELDINTLR